MSGIRFVLRAAPEQRLDLSPLTPERLAGLTPHEIEALPLHTTRLPARVGDVFRVAPGEVDRIAIEGGSERFDNAGEGMRGGVLVVEGAVGQRAGRGLAGGAVEIRGDAGRLAGSGLRGGSLLIVGDAGPHLGGPLPGEVAGMRGGTILVRGNAGKRAAERLRRGLVIVEGDAGEHAGAAMVAGTLVVCGRAGQLPGVLMRRGTIVLAGGTDRLAPTFVPAAPVELVFAGLLARAVAPLSERAAAAMSRAGRRWLGDMAVLARGELLLPD